MLFLGYSLAAALMIGAAVLEILIGVNAEQRGLEELAPPLSSAEF